MNKLITATIIGSCLVVGSNANAGPRTTRITDTAITNTSGATLTATNSGKKGADDQLSTSEILSRLIEGTPGDWKFIGAGSASLTSGKKVRVGSDYSGHCITYKSQKRGINLGHVSDCSKTTGGTNVTFKVGSNVGRVVRYGDVVSLSVSGADKPFVCYGERDSGINLNWGANDDACKKMSGAKNNPAGQWKLMPPSGSIFKVGDAVPLDGRFALHNVVVNQAVVKCARITGATTYLAGDLKWRNDCLGHELAWTHRELLESLGKDPKALALALVPAQYRKYLDKLL